MKRLYLLRHAQALSSSDGGDKARKLSPQGLDDALALGKTLASKKYLPDYILCSPAIRTRETCDQVLKSFAEPPPVSLPEPLYNGSTGTLFSAVQDLDDAHDSALVVAHNPGIHDFAARLCSEESPVSLISRLMQGYKPASLSVLDCPVMVWNDLNLHENILVDYMEPIDYNAPATPARWT